MGSVRDVDESILERARSLLPYISMNGHEDVSLATLGDVPELFVQLFERITMETIPEDKKPFSSRHDKAGTLQKIIGTLEQHLSLPMSHISGWGLVMLDRRQLADALQIFSDLVTELFSLDEASANGQHNVPPRNPGGTETADSMCTPPSSTRPIPDSLNAVQQNSSKEEQQRDPNVNTFSKTKDVSSASSSLHRSDHESVRPRGNTNTLLLGNSCPSFVSRTARPTATFATADNSALSAHDLGLYKTGENQAPNVNRRQLGTCCNSSASSTTHAKQPFSAAEVSNSHESGLYSGSRSKEILLGTSSPDGCPTMNAYNKQAKGSIQNRSLKRNVTETDPFGRRSVKITDHCSTISDLPHKLREDNKKVHDMNSMGREFRADSKPSRTSVRDKIYPYPKPTELSFKVKFNLKNKTDATKERKESGFRRNSVKPQTIESALESTQLTDHVRQRDNTRKISRTSAQSTNGQNDLLQRKPFVVGTSKPWYRSNEKSAGLKIRKPSVKTFSPATQMPLKSKKISAPTMSGRSTHGSHADPAVLVDSAKKVDDTRALNRVNVVPLAHKRRLSVVSTKVRKHSVGASIGTAAGRWREHSSIKLPATRAEDPKPNLAGREQAQYPETKSRDKHFERGIESPQTTSLCASLKLLKEFDYLRRRLRQIQTQRQELLHVVSELDAEKVRLEHVLDHIREHTAVHSTVGAES